MNGFEVLYESSWRGAVALGLAYVACQIAKRQPATLRHGIWVSALLTLPLYPVMATLLPPGSLASAGGMVHRIFAPGTVITVEGMASSSLTTLTLLSVVWLCGVLLMLARWAWGATRLRSIHNRAVPAGNPIWQQVLTESGIAAPVELKESAEIESPLSWGLWHPAVLLPESARQWSPERLRTVLRHELAHIARRDSWTQVLTQMMTAAYWFHPLVWLATAQLKREREQACDDRVLALGVKPSVYAQDLLEIATGRTVPLPALGVAESSTLSARITAILDQSQRRGQVQRPVLIGSILAGILILLPLTTAQAFQPAQEREKQEEKKSDESGTPKRIRVGSNVMQAKLVHKVAPAYPAEAKAKGIQGTVILNVLISKEGTVNKIEAQEFPDQSLMESAVEAVRQWRYATTLLNGDAVEVITQVTVNYTLAP